MVDFGAAGLMGFARVQQTITMPRLSRSELLVVEISTRGAQGGDWPSVKVGTHWYDVAGMTTWTVARRCLGAAQYAPESSRGKGVAMPLEIMPTFAAMTLYIDRVEIRPALVGECVAPGPVLNGNAEADAGWSFRTGFSNGPDSTFAGFVAGQGANGSRAARIFVERRCDIAEVTVKLALPGLDELPSPALSFYNRTTAGGAVELLMPLQSMVPGTGMPTTVVQCLQPFQRGEPIALKGFLSPGGACASAVNYESIFDDIAIINEPKCGTDAIADPGFESRYLPIGVQFEATASTATIVTGAGQVHGGAAALKLAATRPCYGPSYEMYVDVPATSAVGGPALSFFYKATPVNNYSFTADTATITQDNTWRSGVICFDPLLAGRSQHVLFQLTGGGSCLQTIPEESVMLDDLALTNDPSCPK